MKNIVTVDGPAGSGKSTIAKLLANRIGFTYLDTGSLYRGITYFLLQNKINAKDSYKIAHLLSSVHLTIAKENDKDKVLLNNSDITEHIRNPEVTKNVPSFAQNPEIRKFIKTIQQHIGEKGKCVVDGRDIGTVIFPDAFCKFYLDASAAVRAQRRLKDEKEGDRGKTAEEIETEIRERDQMDKTREISPLKIPVDALLIDTSALTIDQVIAAMIDFYNKKLPSSDNISYSIDVKDNKLFMDALENIPLEENTETGTLLKGRIINITSTEIILDIGDKRDGVIPSDETSRIDRAALKIGETIDVFLVNNSPSRSQIIVSKLEADKRSGLIKMKECFEQNTIIQGTIKESVSGGFVIDIMGNRVFCPFSEFDVRKVNKEKYINTPSDFYVIEIKGDKAVVSRKKVLEEKFKKLRDEFFNRIRIGDVLDGTIVNITDFGCFVEIEEGITAILRPKNISWKRYQKITDLLKKGDTVKGVVIAINAEKHKLEISRKETEDDPLVLFAENHKIDSIIKGEVKNVESFGAFVEVADGLEGLVHVSELSWTKRISHPNEVLKKGDFVETKLLSIDIPKRKISLGLKQVMVNPWDTIEQRFPEGEVISAKITSIIKNGLYCEVADEFEGFIHIDNISWSTDKINIKSMFTEGDTIEVKVIGYNKSKKRLELGLKQKTANPWDDLRVNYGVGSTILGEITKLHDTGAFVKLSDDIEGFCHISQLTEKKIEQVSDAAEVGQKTNFVIQSIDEKNKKVALSVKEFIRKQEKYDIEKYLDSADNVKRVTIADLLK